uniref:enoyl-CoA hydratase/isomerase family protein n=1 Tax=Polaromonas sp. TaxID=1869339 RepID=UPI002FC97DCC
MNITLKDPSAPVLHTRDARGVHWLTLNRPASFNTLSEEVLAALQAALDTVAQDQAARVLVLAAQGKAFCA